MRFGIGFPAVAISVVLMAPHGAAAEDGVRLSSKQGVGTYLSDASGKALYWFTKDSPGKSACTGACIDRWPLFRMDSGALPPAGLPAADFATITREDGRMQTTFRGYPLYYFAGDSKAGDTTGQNVGGVWFLIDPAAFPAK